MYFKELSETWNETESVDGTPVHGDVDRQPTEVPQTGRPRSVRSGEDDRDVTTSVPVHKHAATALPAAVVSRCP